MFDASIDRYNVYKVENKPESVVYKVETIGDAYMVASGVPTVYDRHAQEMSLLALELSNLVKEHVIPHLPERTVQLRIGLHSGSSAFTDNFFVIFPTAGRSRHDFAAVVVLSSVPPSIFSPARSV